MKILIGYDGSECADAALIDLKRAGLPSDAEVLVVSAADVFIPPEDVEEEELFPAYVPASVKLARERAQRAFDEAERLSRQAAQKLREIFSEWTVNSVATAGVPHWEIIAKIEEWQPDLTVVGSHGRTALGGLFLGSVSQKVLFEAASSVRIARGRVLPLERPIKLILATDGSPDADAMIDTVCARKWPAETKIKLVTAVENFHRYSEDPDTQFERVRNIQILAVKKLGDAGLAAEAVVTDIDPKSYLIIQAEKWDADCIFLGAKGHRFFERLLIGSVSSSVAARAHCSVEVVRKAA